MTFTGQCKLRNNKIKNLSGNGNGVGGGMYLANSHLYLNGSIIVVKNVAMKNGGGMCILSSSIWTTNHSSLVIAENIAQSGDGGGLYVCDARANIAGSMVLTSNIAFYYGGGISVYKSTWSNTGHVLLYNNTSQYADGSGIDLRYASMVMTYFANFTQNSARHHGGVFIFLTQTLPRHYGRLSSIILQERMEEALLHL